MLCRVNLNWVYEFTSIENIMQRNRYVLNSKIIKDLGMVKLAIFAESLVRFTLSDAVSLVFNTVFRFIATRSSVNLVVFVCCYLMKRFIRVSKGFSLLKRLLLHMSQNICLHLCLRYIWWLKTKTCASLVRYCTQWFIVANYYFHALTNLYVHYGLAKVNIVLWHINFRLNIHDFWFFCIFVQFCK